MCVSVFQCVDRVCIQTHTHTSQSVYSGVCGQAVDYCLRVYIGQCAPQAWWELWGWPVGCTVSGTFKEQAV